MKSVTETIKTLIAQRGIEIIQQPQRLKAMLADLLPHEKRMRYLLEVSMRAEIPAKLKEIQKAEKDVRETKINVLKHYFKEEYFLEDNAVKSVFDCWVEVIKINKPIVEFNLETATDIDGNVYKTVKIGDQVWMAENLKTTRYNDGTSIPNFTNSLDYNGKVAPAYFWYDNDIINP